MARDNKRVKPSHYNTGVQSGKMPPQASDLEQALLGALLMDADLKFDIIGKLESREFYRIEHQKVYEAMLFEDRKSGKFDMMTITNRLKEMGELEMVGGGYFVSELTQGILSGANSEVHMRIIKQKFLQREIIRVGGDFYHRGFEDTTDPLDLIDDLAIESLKLSNILDFDKKEVQLGAASNTFNDEVRQRQADGVSGQGMRSGYKEFDEVTGGWQPTDLVIVAGRPGMGKTAWAISAAMAAAELGTPSAFFSMEMATDQVVKRAQANYFSFNHDHIVNEKLEGWQLEEIDNSQRFQNMPLFIQDEPAMDIHALRSKIIEYHRSHGVKLVFIDYLQLISGKNPDMENASVNHQIGYYTKTLKSIAKKLGITIVLLSQLSRKVDERGGKRIPRISDLRDSGEIEQDADRILFCYRPEFYGIEYTEPIGPNNMIFSTEKIAELLMQKNRHGKNHNFIMIFEGEHMRWREPNETELADKMGANGFNPKKKKSSGPAPTPQIFDLDDDYLG